MSHIICCKIFNKYLFFMWGCPVDIRLFTEFVTKHFVSANVVEL